MNYLTPVNPRAEKLADQVLAWIVVGWAGLFLAVQAVFAWVLRPGLPESMVLQVGVGTDVARNAIVLNTQQITVGGWFVAAIFVLLAMVVIISELPIFESLRARLGDRWLAVRMVLILVVCSLAPVIAGIILGSGLVSTIDPDAFSYDFLPAILVIGGLAGGVMSMFVMPRRLADRLLKRRAN